MHNSGKYHNRGKYNFPHTDINPKEKDQDYHKQFCEAMYSMYVNDLGGILYSKRDEFLLFRRYADGNQPTEKYMDWNCPKDAGTGDRKGVWQISWDIQSPIPIMRDIAINRLMEIDHNVIATAIDEDSTSEKKELEWRMEIEKKLEPWINQINPELVDEEIAPHLEYMPSSAKERKIWMDAGNFKLQQENELVKVVQLCKYNSEKGDGFDVLRRRVLEDFFDIGVGMVRDFVEPTTQEVKSMYVDPTRVIIPYSRTKTFNHIDRWGYVEDLTIAEFRKRAPELSEDQIAEIGKEFVGYAGNPGHWTYTEFYDDYAVNGNNFPYDNWTIQVLHCEWIEYDTSKYSKKKAKNRTGHSIYREDYTKKTKKTLTKEVKESRKQVVRKCSWVIGSAYAYDFGYQNDVPKSNDNEARLSLHAYRSSIKSKTSQMMPLADAFQNNWLKLQNANAKASPAGLAIEWGSLANISQGKKKLQPLDILSIRRSTGDLLFKSTNHHNQVISPNAGKPVTPLEGGVGQYLDEMLKYSEQIRQWMRDLTGINEYIDASGGNQYANTTTVDAAQASADKGLATLHAGWTSIHERSVRSMCKRVQIVARYKDISAYIPAVGKDTMEAIKFGSDYAARMYGIMLEEKPSKVIRERLLNVARESVALRKQGGVGISLKTYFYIERMLENDGNLRYAQLVIAQEEEKAEAQKQQIADRMQEMNNQGSQQLEGMKQEGENQGAYRDGEIANQHETHKAQLRTGEYGEKSQRDMASNQIKEDNTNLRQSKELSAKKEQTDTEVTKELLKPSKNAS